MFGQNHQAHSSRPNGVGGGQRIGGMPLYSFQQSSHQHQSPGQHHQSIQQDHVTHNVNGSVLSSHSTFSSGVLSSASPFHSALQNGHVSASRAGQAQQMSEHMSELLHKYEESKQAHRMMIEQRQPQWFARLKASENRGVASNTTGNATNSDNPDDRDNLDEAEENGQEWHGLDMSGQSLRSISMPLFDNYKFLKELYISSNKLSALPASIGELRQLTLLEASFNILQELPPQLGMCTELKQLLVFNNELRELPSNLGSLYKLEVLGIEGNRLDEGLRQEVMDKGTKSVITWLREKGQPRDPPPPRQTITIQEDVSPHLERVKVFSWNILAEKMATASQYGYTPSAALAWENRKQNIINEIRMREADIICLQEIVGDVYKSFFVPELESKYCGVYFPRARAKTMFEKDSLSVDGCAIFYNKDKYKVVEKPLWVDFQQLALNHRDMKGCTDMFNRVMPKDHIGVLCLLQNQETGSHLIVANAHLVWEKHLGDVKAVQTAILLEAIKKAAEKWIRLPSVKRDATNESGLQDGEDPPPSPAMNGYRSITDIPLLICGDYNSTKGSAVYDLFSKGRIPPDHRELAPFNYGHFTQHGIEHPFSLRSSYAHLENTADELVITNYTPTFKGVIDYIWYSTNTLEVVELLGPPDPDYLKLVPGFPHWYFPSDHIQIMAEFAIKAKKDKKHLPEPDFGGGPSGERRDRG